MGFPKRSMLKGAEYLPWTIQPMTGMNSSGCRMGMMLLVLNKENILNYKLKNHESQTIC
jgi:hypothetical protein